MVDYYIFENKIIHEALSELWTCFVYEESDIIIDAQISQDDYKIYANAPRIKNSLGVSTENTQQEDTKDRPLLIVRTIPKFEEYKDTFQKLCEDKTIDSTQTYILTFMASIFIRRVHHLFENTIIEELQNEIDCYQRGIRPDLLRLYIELEKNKRRRNQTVKIKFAYSEPVAICKKFPWFNYMMEEYLKKYLGVESIEEAQEELTYLYSEQKGKNVKGDNLYLNYIIASTYTYIARNIIPSENKKVTKAQCELLKDFLSAFHLLPQSAKNNNINNLQSTVKSLVVDSNSCVIERFRKYKHFRPNPRKDINDIYWCMFWK